MSLDDATLRQRAAARPDRSTWLSANAGSGKTRVLTDRVARLLLDGTDPLNILCLTYTKAAAAEMQNRLFSRLGEWAMLPDDDLRQELESLGASVSDPAILSEARRLFARAIDTPGGLKIQTIHAFCAALLRRFPLEAGVSPGFRELEGREQALLIRAILDELSEADPEGVVSEMMGWLGGSDISSVVRGILDHADAFRSLPPEAETAAALGLGAVPRDADVLAPVQAVWDQEAIDRVVALLDAHGSTGRDTGLANKLRILRPPETLADLEPAEDVFLTGKDTKTPFAPKTGQIPKKAIRALDEDACAALDPMIDAVAIARDARIRAKLFARSRALQSFGHLLVTTYERRKAERGLLDFGDLIARARHLLTDPARAAWVLFRLDGGIDHILVDEAQDTSPEQWDVVRRLAEEFAAGDGARPDVVRTLFVVGDKKQSIYSFQGADPDEFDRMKRHFAQGLSAVGQELQDLQLAHSFRSSPAVLEAVDATFTDEMAQGLEDEVRHLAFRETLPGRVDLWAPIEQEKDDEQIVWYEPLDRREKYRAEVRLAETIAREVRRMIEEETIPHWSKDDKAVVRRPVTAGDVLILVQKRKNSTLFYELIRCCKAEGLDVAGPDKMALTGSLAVRDICAVLEFLALPENDHALACALRSPLFGWTEAELFDIAHGRRGTLWEALRETKRAETLAIIDDMMAQADFLRPFDLISRLLVLHEGRQRLIGRLGPEAEDGIDALLAQALAYEQREVPSLTGFLTWIGAEEVEVKRQAEAQGTRLRVMTVHGAKGLEAPIVFLPDTGNRKREWKREVVLAGGVPLWKPLAAETVPEILELKEADLARQDEERRRLLYVAMTRAESWLVVCGAGDMGEARGDSWYRMVEHGVAPLAQSEFTVPGTEIAARRLSRLDWDGPGLRPPLTDASVEEDPPTLAPLPPVAPPPETLTPSDLGGAKALPGEGAQDEEAAKSFGTLVHRLLEVLPQAAPDRRATVAGRLLDGVDGAVAVAAMAHVEPILDSPEFDWIFAPGSLAEVDVAATLPDGRRLFGTIDRLVERDGEIHVIDYKTNHVVPARPEATPDGLLAQLGAYVAALAPLYPGKRIRAHILWTATPALMEIPHDLATGALCGLTAP